MDDLPPPPPPHSTSLRSSSSSLRLIRDSASTMFERVMGRKRRDDYHSGSHHHSHHSSRHNTNNNNIPTTTTTSASFIHSIREEDGVTGGLGGGEAMLYPMETHGTNSSRSSERKFFFCCGGSSRSLHESQQQQILYRQEKYSKMIRSSYWNISMIFFAFVLLFGDTIRTIFLPPVLDNVMDAIFIITIVFFLYDIYIRIVIVKEEHYFTIPAFLQQRNNNKYRGHQSEQSTPNTHHRPHHHHHRSNPNSHQNDTSHYDPYTWYEIIKQVFTCGSFLFWCDLLSTLALLYDITWVNTILFREAVINIVLDQFGIPIDGLSKINQAEPFELDPKLLVTILQSARVARFIRSSTAVKISSKVNWFFMLNLCNPIWCFQQLFCINTTTKTNTILCCHRGNRRPNDNATLIQTSSSHGGVASLSLSGGGGGGVSASMSLPSVPSPTAPGLSTPSSSLMMQDDTTNRNPPTQAIRMKHGPAGNGLSQTIQQWFWGGRFVSSSTMVHATIFSWRIIMMTASAILVYLFHHWFTSSVTFELSTPF
jgi:hypothetical protein